MRIPRDTEAMVDALLVVLLTFGAIATITIIVGALVRYPLLMAIIPIGSVMWAVLYIVSVRNK